MASTPTAARPTGRSPRSVPTGSPIRFAPSRRTTAGFPNRLDPRSSAPRSLPALEAVLAVRTHDRTLEHAVADLSARGELRRVLGQAPVRIARVGRWDLLPLDHELALVHAVAPIGFESVTGPEEQGEGHERFDLHLGGLLSARTEIGKGGAGHHPVSGCEAQLVLGSTEPFGFAPAADRED